MNEIQISQQQGNVRKRGGEEIIQQGDFTGSFQVHLIIIDDLVGTRVGTRPIFHKISE